MKPFFVRVLYIIFWLGLGYLIIRFLLPVLSPFVLAFIVAAVFEPVVRRFEARVGVRRWVMSGFLTLMLIGGVFGVCRGVVSRAAGGFGDILASLSGVGAVVERVTVWVEGFVSSAPPPVRDWLYGALDGASERISQIPAELSAGGLRLLTRVLSRAPDILLFIATFAVGTFFISSRFPEVRGFLRRQIPEGRRGRWNAIRSGVAGTVVKWLKAQFLLMCVTFCELTAGFFLIAVPHPILTALITALIDALPVLGVGTVLLPWAAYSLLTGESGTAVGLGVLYLVITLMRSFLEPKIVGSQLGLHPVASLLAIYAGFRTLGVGGMILFPMGLMALKQLNDEGVVHIWK